MSKYNIDPDKIKINDIIPQRPPMQLIKRVLEINDGYSECEAEITDRNPFINNNKMPETFLIEMIAQSVAAVNGIKFKRRSDKSVPEGYLVGVKKFSIYKNIPLNQKLTITVKETARLDNISVYSGNVYNENMNKICEGSLKFYLNT